MFSRINGIIDYHNEEMKKSYNRRAEIEKKIISVLLDESNDDLEDLKYEFDLEDAKWRYHMEILKNLL